MAVRPIELSKDHPTVELYGGTDTVTVTGSSYIYTPIIAWKVPRQVAWAIVKNPKIRMKLKDNNGDELPANTRLLISIKKPRQELFQEIATAKYYSPYRELTTTEQLNAENDAAVRFNLRSAGTYPEESLLVILAQTVSDITLDWSKSEIYIGNVATSDLVEVDM